MAARPPQILSQLVLLPSPEESMDEQDIQGADQRVHGDPAQSS
jgi:hypothetical protein